MHVTVLKALTIISLLHEPKQNIAAVVDPAEAEPVLEKLQELEAELVAIFNTHHHNDHVGGNRQLIQRFGHVKVYGGERIEAEFRQQVFLQEGDHVHFADRSNHIRSGHTRAHIAYYFAPRKPVKQETYSAAILYLLAAVVGCLKAHRLKWLIQQAAKPT